VLDIEVKKIENQALAVGKDPNGNDVNDTSDDPMNPDDVDSNGDGEPDDKTVTTLPVSCITGYVWEDKNGNGIYDKGQEQPLEGIRVKAQLVDGNISKKMLLKEPSKADNDVRSREDGYYEICGLAPGKYVVYFNSEDLGDEYVPSVENHENPYGNDVPSDQTPEDGWIKSHDVTLTKNGVTKSNAAVVKGLSIGDYVWYDDNANGIQDEDEKGVVGLTVKLYTLDGKEAVDVYGNPVKPVKTDNKGHYHFEHLKPNEGYKVALVLPEGYLATKQNQGNSDKLDSDALPNGELIIKSLSSADASTQDIGIYCECNPNTDSTKTTSASSFNLLGGAFAIIAMLYLARRREEV
jgi:hypothetical protein